MLAAKDDALVGLWLEGQKYFGNTLKGEAWERDDCPALIRAKEWLDPAGSAFRKTVWNILCQIPYGEVATYGEIAEKVARILGKEGMSFQAVGGAVGHNAVSIIIPCHRVVGANGSLTGYAGGIAKKIELLIHEGAYGERFFVPKKTAAP